MSTTDTFVLLRAASACLPVYDGTELVLLKNNDIMLRFSDCTTEVKVNSLLHLLYKWHFSRLSHLQLTTKKTLSASGEDLGFLKRVSIDDQKL